MKFYIFLSFLVGTILYTCTEAGETEEGSKIPLITKQCIAEGPFSCAEYEETLSVEGVSCTEDCVILSTLNRCQVRNRCTWDPSSGCFRKRVCTEISDLGTCSKWEKQAVCD